jgi:lysophospholipid acyltransferase (LPLAT)-like uncharacterized protein
MQAFSKMTKLLREEHHIAIIPDGPKGPPRELKSGVLKLAQLTGKPIVPFGWNATRFRRLGSWDKMVLPLPFSTIHFDTGSKIFVPREATDDQLASIGEKLCSELDRVSGYL